MGRSKLPRSSNGSIWLIPLGLPFLAVGVWMGSTLVGTYLESAAMQRWQEVPAHILRADLKTHPNRGGCTCEATAEYTYSFGGQQFTGTRVSLYREIDDFGSFQSKLHQELKKYQKSRQAFRCYVNPAHPSEAILYRNPRGEIVGFFSLFVLLFGGAGLAMLVCGFSCNRRLRAEKKRAVESPDQPWLWHDDWAKGEIHSSNRHIVAGLGLLTLFWNLVSLPVLLFVPGDAFDSVLLLFLLLPAIGIGLLIVAGYQFLRWRKFGDSVFQMAAVPGVIGGKLAGVIRIPTRIRSENGYRLSLRCVHRYTRRTSESDRTCEQILWQDDQVISQGLSEADFAQTAIPVLFAIPYDARPSEGRGTDGQIVWRLELTARVPGIDYQARFEIPVFKTEKSRPDFQLNRGPLAPYAAPVNPEQRLSEAGVIKTLAPDGSTRYVFPMARCRGAALGLAAFTTIWTGVLAAMVHFGAPIFFTIVFGLLDALLLWFSLELWFFRSVVDVSPHGLTISAGLLGFGRPRSIAAADVASISIKDAMQSGNKAYYDLVVRLQPRKSMTAAKWLPNRPCAEAIVRAWELELGKQ